MKQLRMLGVVVVKRDLADCFVIMNQVVGAAISLCRIKNGLLLQYIAANIFDLLHWKAEARRVVLNACCPVRLMFGT
jgi:hypothetical protein